MLLAWLTAVSSELLSLLDALEPLLTELSLVLNRLVFELVVRSEGKWDALYAIKRLYIE